MVRVRVRVVIHGVIVTVVCCTSLRQKLVFLLRDLTIWRGCNLYLAEGRRHMLTQLFYTKDRCVEITEIRNNLYQSKYCDIIFKKK